MISLLLYQTLAFTRHRKIQKSHTKIINLKYQLWHGMENFNHLMDHILCIRYSRLFWIFLKKHETVTDNSSIMIYINKIENRITFKIKTAYFLEFSTPETIKLLGSTKSKITKYENGENLPHLEITEIVLIHCNVANNDYQQD